MGSLPSDNLRKQLSVVVRSIQWSYAIFWGLSTKQQGALEWVDGYYNGDTRIRKTVQAVEPKPDKIGMKRSEQLRELYESLVEAETDEQVERPSASISTDDLSDAEWYYLVCMSFVFNLGQSLPGKALANGETIWLCNAASAETKTFSRSLLAKSASIQTVVCFPYLEGVVELGVSELVSEDRKLLQHIKASLLNLTKPICSAPSAKLLKNTDDDEDQMYAVVDQADITDEADDEFDMDSPDECSNDCEHDHQSEDSMSLDDCTSRAFHQDKNMIGNTNKFLRSDKKIIDATDFGTNDDDLHYKRLVTAVLKSSLQTIKPFSHSFDYKSSFTGWKKGGTIGRKRPVRKNMLRNILFVIIPQMHNGCSLRSRVENQKTDLSEEHFFPDKRKENDRLSILKSMVPSIIELFMLYFGLKEFYRAMQVVSDFLQSDKSAILNHAIGYLKELEARVEELEDSCMDKMELRATTGNNQLNMAKRASDNRAADEKMWINKRKATELDETDLKPEKVVVSDGSDSDVKVNIKEAEVKIKVKCRYREHILLDIMVTMNNLNLDAHSVQSDAIDNTLTLTIQSKLRDTSRAAAATSAGMIKEALWKTVVGSS